MSQLLMLAGEAVAVYLNWCNHRRGNKIENRPVLAILKEVAEIRGELTLAQREITRRKAAEAEKEQLIRKLEGARIRARRLEGLLPVCSNCRKVRIEPLSGDAPDRWVSLEDYMREKTTARFSHGVCEACMRQLYPELPEKVIRDAARGRGGVKRFEDENG